MTDLNGDKTGEISNGEIGQYQFSVPPSTNDKEPALTSQQKAENKTMLSKGSEYLKNLAIEKPQVLPEHLATLKGRKWLNDAVVNFYLELISRRSRQIPEMPKVYTFNSFFYERLCSDGYEGVKRWAKVDIFSQDLVLLPIHHENSHWCLICIDFRKKTISYYDSLHDRNDECLQRIMGYLVEESAKKQKMSQEDESSWQMVNMEDKIPLQKNTWDCGVFAVTTAEFLSRGADLIFDQVPQGNLQLIEAYNFAP
ncbi:unnamed protein product [Rodentolepis nana]|uniref:ULP_PROTEASE domain-containing protein n=1 Tax=Rodentolepis nana TaxID=102285 RepID=A0A0R3T2W4_RODNA|nr:unnamed protein product [Rodentolepis nana]